MTLTAFLAELRQRDIRVWIDRDRLRCSAPEGALTPELHEALGRRKEEIVLFLQSADALAGQPRAIIPLQAGGTRIPIFAVGGHNGDVFCYRALARHLGAAWPLYGLQPPGLDRSSEPIESIERLAAHFASEIVAFHPGGACIIAGFCAGGATAFELARQLTERGCTVSMLALFGAPYPTIYRRLPMLRHQVRTRARQLAHAVSRPRHSWAVLRGKVRQRSGPGPEDATTPDRVLALRARMERVILAAARRYTPPAFTGRTAIFLPNAAWPNAHKDGLRWQEVAPRNEVYVGPDGCDGDDMLLEPHAATFAALFNDAVSENRPPAALSDLA